jgi:hypothetical protein
VQHSNLHNSFSTGNFIGLLNVAPHIHNRQPFYLFFPAVESDCCYLNLS